MHTSNTKPDTSSTSMLVLLANASTMAPIPDALIPFPVIMTHHNMHTCKYYVPYTTALSRCIFGMAYAHINTMHTSTHLQSRQSVRATSWLSYHCYIPVLLTVTSCSKSSNIVQPNMHYKHLITSHHQSLIIKYHINNTGVL